METEHTIQCQLKTSIYKKIKHLLSLYPKTEWSGVAFYNKLNEDTYGWATKWELVAFYPIDLGSTAATEFSGEEVLNMTQKAYDKNPKLKECYKGLIHSHHTLSGGAFFSGTDRNQMEECANVVGYPSLVVANDSTGSPFAFSVSWLDQLGKIHWTEESEGCVTLNYTNYKPSGLFEECLDSLKKQESVIKNSSLTYFNGKQGSLFNNGMYNRVGLYQPHTNQFNDDYKDNIKDKKYQKLLKKFRKADNLFFDSHVTDDLSYNKKKEDAVNAEAELDAYCIEKGYNQEMGWL